MVFVIGSIVSATNRNNNGYVAVVGDMAVVNIHIFLEIGLDGVRIAFVGNVPFTILVLKEGTKETNARTNVRIQVVEIDLCI